MKPETRRVAEPAERAEPGKQVPQWFVDPADKTRRLDYLLYLPRDYGREQTHWPLMLFLHGAGERGRNVHAVKRHGPPKLIERGDDLPFIVASPQCPAEHWWVEEDFQRLLWELLEELFARYEVDQDRVYLTGISMGGFGSWMLAARHPECFAAVVPVCGGGDAAWAERLKPVPIWAFHGARDDVVPIEFSKRMVAAVRAAGGNVELTVYSETGHDSWTQTYDNPEVFRWMLSHQRPGEPPERKAK